MEYIADKKTKLKEQWNWHKLSQVCTFQNKKEILSQVVCDQVPYELKVFITNINLNKTYMILGHKTLDLRLQ